MCRRARLPRVRINSDHAEQRLGSEFSASTSLQHARDELGGGGIPIISADNRWRLFDFLLLVLSHHAAYTKQASARAVFNPACRGFG